jgi:signal transduction histidine kinase
MRHTFLKNISLQRKFIIITFAVVILFMIVMGVMVTGRESTIMYRDIERQGKLLAQTLAIPVMNDLIYERLGLVEEGGLIDNYVTEIFTRKDIDLIYLTVLDGKGRVTSHNDFNEYGKIYNDPITIKSLVSDKTEVQKFYNEASGHDALDIATPLSIGKKRWGTLKFAISLKRLDNELRATVIGVIISTLILLAGSFGVIVLLSRRFIRPITKLAGTMESAGGDLLDVKVDAEGGDEIALLGQSFNRMIERIRVSNHKLQQTHEELLQFVSNIEKTSGDILDVKVDIEGCDEITLLCESFNEMIDRIKKSNIELKRTHEKLFQSQKLASIGILASGVAHEINNPLGGMFNCVQMLQEMGKDEEFRNRYIKLLDDGLKRIENTVGKLLWMSRKEDKKPDVVEIKQALKDVYRFIEYKIKNNNITYNENVDNGVSVVIDPHDIQQIMLNLMINAVQSMNSGGTLNVEAKRNNSHVIVEVSDTGKGIDREDLNKVFDPFYTTKMPGEGTGLGLWVTYEIVKSYDGDISVESNEGEGSTFVLKLNRA